MLCAAHLICLGALPSAWCMGVIGGGDVAGSPTWTYITAVRVSLGRTYVSSGGRPLGAYAAAVPGSCLSVRTLWQSSRGGPHSLRASRVCVDKGHIRGGCA